MIEDRIINYQTQIMKWLDSWINDLRHITKNETKFQLWGAVLHWCPEKQNFLISDCMPIVYSTSNPWRKKPDSSNVLRNNSLFGHETLLWRYFKWTHFQPEAFICRRGQLRKKENEGGIRIPFSANAPCIKGKSRIYRIASTARLSAPFNCLL